MKLNVTLKDKNSFTDEEFNSFAKKFSEFLQRIQSEILEQNLENKMRKLMEEQEIF